MERRLASLRPSLSVNRHSADHAHFFILAVRLPVMLKRVPLKAKRTGIENTDVRHVVNARGEMIVVSPGGELSGAGERRPRA